MSDFSAQCVNCRHTLTALEQKHGLRGRVLECAEEKQGIIYCVSGLRHLPRELVWKQRWEWRMGNRIKKRRDADFHRAGSRGALGGKMDTNNAMHCESSRLASKLFRLSSRHLALFLSPRPTRSSGRVAANIRPNSRVDIGGWGEGGGFVDKRNLLPESPRHCLSVYWRSRVVITAGRGGWGLWMTNEEETIAALIPVNVRPHEGWRRTKYDPSRIVRIAPAQGQPPPPLTPAKNVLFRGMLCPRSPDPLQTQS
ncbi:hypothetical protein PR048_000849 [Dryococelus australis]|uniref:Uncharacterized protein n=1 Tax=Dryococelus australis TaxID=614101 RepID=A0ABQ9IFR6_9NEOP|nr:hypothetical protein PR048_000849 [Dryococelus australis]